MFVEVTHLILSFQGVFDVFTGRAMGFVAQSSLQESRHLWLGAWYNREAAYLNAFLRIFSKDHPLTAGPIRYYRTRWRVSCKESYHAQARHHPHFAQPAWSWSQFALSSAASEEEKHRKSEHPMPEADPTKHVESCQNNFEALHDGHQHLSRKHAHTQSGTSPCCVLNIPQHKAD